jgi:P4 family phage/plasmid primase-like protien
MISIPKQLQKEEMSFVLLEKGGKKPFQQGWQNKKIKYNNSELIAHLTCEGNYGVLGGDGLIIIDFDNEKVQNEVITKLPKTFTIKTGSGLLHKYFKTDKTDSFKIFSEEMDTIADVQGTGKQVVGPNSIHPNGNKYEIVDNSEIAFIPYAEIKALLSIYDKKPKKEEIKKEIEPKNINNSNEFLDTVKSSISMKDVISSFGINTSKNPTECYFHSSKGGKCFGFNSETAHCFHCDESWNIFSFVKQAKNCDFKEALEYLVELGGLQKQYEENKKRYIEERNKLNNQEVTNLREDFLMLVKDKKIPNATELIVKELRNKKKFYTTKEDKQNEIWVYHEGIYIPNGRSEIKEMMRKILGSWYNAYYYNLIINKIEADTFIEVDDFFKNNYIYEIPVLNGILNIITKELSPFTQEKIFFNKLPVKYNPKSKCPQIEKFLKEVLSKEEDIKVFYELGGFCLLKEYKFEKAFMFVGDGRNGKDKSLELIKRMVGIENCCSVPLSSLIPESFIISEFFGKMVNTAGEINNTDLKDTSVFKALTGRSLISAPRKFLNPIKLVNYCKFIFACNELPMVYDNSRGFWDRWVLLEFPFTFVSREEYESEKDKNDKLKIRDEDIITKITTEEELSGFLNECLNALDRLLIHRDFSSTLGSKQVKEVWIRKSNSVMAFAMDKIEEDYDSSISKKSFRKHYSDYCKIHKTKPKSDYVIKRTLEEMFGVSEENKKVFGEQWDKVWGGIKWKE